MSDTPDIYQQLLDISQQAFTNQQYLVAYHSLSAVLEHALQLKDVEKIANIKQLVANQSRCILDLGELEPTTNTVAELDLYNSLLSLCTSYQKALSP